MEGHSLNVSRHDDEAQHAKSHDSPESLVTTTSTPAQTPTGRGSHISAPIPIRPLGQTPFPSALANQQTADPGTEPKKTPWGEQVLTELLSIRMAKVAGMTLAVGILVIALLAFIQSLALGMIQTAIGALAIMIGTVICGSLSYYLYKCHIKKECKKRKPVMTKPGCNPEKVCMPLQLALCWCEQNAKKKVNHRKDTAHPQEASSPSEPATQEDPIEESLDWSKEERDWDAA